MTSMRRTIVALATVLASSAAVPAVAQDVADELAVERAELERDRERLAEAAQRVRAAERRVAAAEAALAGAAARLAELEARLATARAAELEAHNAARRAGRRHLDAAERAHRAAARAAEARRALETNVAAAYAHRDVMDASLVVHGLLRADSPHHAVVALRSATRTTQDRHALMVAADRARASADRARAEADVAAAAAAVAVTAARAAADDVADLHAAQAAVVADVAARRAAAVRSLRALDHDEDAMRALVQRRAQRVAELGARLQTAMSGGDTADTGWAGRLPAAGRAWAPRITAAAAGVGMDPRLLAALVWTESSFVPTAVSPVGALGLGQLMPGTAAGLGVDPLDPDDNLRGAARYLRAQVRRFGSVELGLAAYNAGPRRVVEAGNAIPAIAETQLYVVRVLDRYARLSS